MSMLWNYAHRDPVFKLDAISKIQFELKMTEIYRRFECDLIYFSIFEMASCHLGTEPIIN